jgi:hypothetical protein
MQGPAFFWKKEKLIRCDSSRILVSDNGKRKELCRIPEVHAVGLMFNIMRLQPGEFWENTLSKFEFGH